MSPPLACSLVALPYGLWEGGQLVTSLHVRAISGADEMALAEALAHGASAARAGNILLGDCSSLTKAFTPIGATAAQLVVGDREIVLRALHVRSLAPVVAARADCAQCGAAIEYDLDLTQPAAEPPEPGPRHFLPQADPADSPVACRLLTGADLERAAASADPIAALGAAAIDAPSRISATPLGDNLARLDPNAETTIILACPGCGGITRLWLDSFDLIRRALAASGGIFAQIHLLASRYGWSEDAILALPRPRRLLYCAMAATDSPA